MLPPKVCSTLQPSMGCSHIMSSMGATLAFLGGKCCPNSPRNLPYPNVSSSRQPLQEVASHAGAGNRIPLTHCILSSHAVIFTHFKFCCYSHTQSPQRSSAFPLSVLG